MASDALLARIRGEYREMPGMRLTLAQACRLWQLESALCRTLLEQLVLERFLHQMHDGSYIAFPSTRAVKAALPRSTGDDSRVRRRG